MGEDAITLYRRADGALRYHEAWATRGVVIEHWGEVGWPGETRGHPRPAGVADAEAIEAVLARARAEGYEPLPPERHAMLVVEAPVAASFGTPGDVDRCERLQARLDERLRQTGLGRCHGYGVAARTMAVCCLVVDVAIARPFIVADLEGAESPWRIRIS